MGMRAGKLFSLTLTIRQEGEIVHAIGDVGLLVVTRCRTRTQMAMSGQTAPTPVTARVLIASGALVAPALRSALGPPHGAVDDLTRGVDRI